jgi:hypothetical protein
LQKPAVAVRDLLSRIPREFEESVTCIPNRAVRRRHVGDNEGLALDLRPQQTRVLVHAPIAQPLRRSAEGIAVHRRRRELLRNPASGLIVGSLIWELPLHAHPPLRGRLPPNWAWDHTRLSVGAGAVTAAPPKRRVRTQSRTAPRCYIYRAAATAAAVLIGGGTCGSSYDGIRRRHAARARQRQSSARAAPLLNTRIPEYLNPTIGMGIASSKTSP